MGKGGAGLSFLNKKTWHPGRMQNQERLWKAEEDAAQEARQLEELRKKIAEERGREELKGAAVAGGHQKAADRIDWMYSGGMTAKVEADKRNEEAMLGAAPITTQEADKEVTRLEQATLLPSFYAEDTPVAANETWARLHSDPLFAIRQQEQSARKQVVANPAQMHAIKKQVEMLKQAAAAKKAAKKEAKEAKKAEKRAKKDKKAGKRVTSPADPLPLPPPPPAAASHGGYGRAPSPDAEDVRAAKRQRRSSRSPVPHDERPTTRHPPSGTGRDGQFVEADRRHESGRHDSSWFDDRGRRPDNGQHDSRDRGHDNGRHGHREAGHGSAHHDDRAGRHARDRTASRHHESRDGGHDRTCDRDRDADRTSGRYRHAERLSSHDAGRDRDGGRRDGNSGRVHGEGHTTGDRDSERGTGGDGGANREERDGGRSRHADAETRTGGDSRREDGRGRGVDRSTDVHCDRRRSLDEEPATVLLSEVQRTLKQPTERRHAADGAAAQGEGVQYGLNVSVHQDNDRSGAAAATLERLEAAAKAKEEADRAAKLAQGQRRAHTAGRLTAEEKAARLAEMSGNAAEHADSRAARLKHAANKDAAVVEAEGTGGERHHTDTDRFMKTVTKDVYGAEGGGSLEERVARRKYYNERGVGSTDRNAFRRG